MSTIDDSHYGDGDNDGGEDTTLPPPTDTWVRVVTVTEDPYTGRYTKLMEFDKVKFEMPPLRHNTHEYMYRGKQDFDGTWSVWLYTRLAKHFAVSLGTAADDDVSDGDGAGVVEGWVGLWQPSRRVLARAATEKIVTDYCQMANDYLEYVDDGMEVHSDAK